MVQPSVVSVGVRHWAEAAPDRIAVADVSTTMTYAEFDAAVSAVADELLRSTSGSSTGESPWLPVLVDRSAASAVALCGAIRAGRRYSPIAADVPRARLAELVQRLGSPDTVLVARREFATALPAPCRTVSVDGAMPWSGGPAPMVPVSPRSLGMAVFTSGSTGQPKCALRPWEMFDRAIADQVALGPVSDPDQWRWGGIQPFTFGGSRALAVLALGGGLIVIDPAAHEIGTFLHLLHHWRVNESNLVPTLARSMIAASGGVRRLPHLQRVLLGGEPVDGEVVAPLRSLVAEDAAILHEFGSSESGRVFLHRLDPDVPVGPGRVPVGRPVAGRTVRLDPVDGSDTMRHLVVGDPDSVAYLGADDELARRFTTDSDGTVWYATGDLFAATDDGAYRHVGRVDDMVKINGMLVEPREPEMTLTVLPGVAAAAVLPERTTAGHWRLVAHVVIDDPGLTPEGVRRSLEARLPRHLVPSVMVRHASLPFNDRLKLDRSALSSMPRERWRSAPPRVTTNEAERWVMGQLRVVLDTDDVSPDDDVWLLGLDSLGAVELCTRLAEGGMGEIDPPMLLEHRTSAQIAQLGTGTRRRLGSPCIMFHANGSLTPVVAVPGSGGTSLGLAALSNELGADQPFVVIEPRGLHTKGRPHRGIGRMAEHVIDHLPSGIASRPFVLVGYSGGAVVAHEVARRLGVRGAAPSLVLIEPADGAITAGGSSSRPRRGLSRLAGALWTRLRLEIGSAVGRVRIEQARYWWFYRIHAAAARRHRLEPLAVPVNVVVARRSAVTVDARSISSHTTVVEVDGDHHTAMQSPHVAAVAAVVREVAESLRSSC